MNEIVEELLKRLNEDQREEFEERAGIMQYDGGLTRDHAECLAMLYLLKKYHTGQLVSYIEGPSIRKGDHHGHNE
jgi:hypothetical protein